MSDKTKKTKTCSKGHVMDASWKICPYCGDSVTADAPQSAKTVVEGGNPTLKKTVREDVAAEAEKAQKAEEAAKAAGERKTKILKGRTPEVQALAWLVALDGPARAAVYQLVKDKTTVGSSVDCDIQLDDSFVSTRHASVHFERGKYFIMDLDSANGTFVNQKRVTRRALLDGDIVKLGGTTYGFKFIVL